MLDVQLDTLTGKQREQTLAALAVFVRARAAFAAARAERAHWTVECGAYGRMERALKKLRSAAKCRGECSQCT